jgi:hypothetical protein
VKGKNTSTGFTVSPGPGSCWTHKNVDRKPVRPNMCIKFWEEKVVLEYFEMLLFATM